MLRSGDRPFLAGAWKWLRDSLDVVVFLPRDIIDSKADKGDNSSWPVVPL
jgi:hypothetical protein